MADKTYTHDEVSQAANNGADLVTGQLDLGDRDYDLINIVVNAIMSLLDNPGFSLDEVFDANWDDVEETDKDGNTVVIPAHEVVRSWHNW